MSLEIAHRELSWPAPGEIRNPAGEGSRIFVDLAKVKIGSGLSQYLDAEGAQIGVLLRNPYSVATEAPLAIVVEFNNRVGDSTLQELHRLAWNFSHSPTVITVEPDLLRVWTCCEPPDAQRSINEYVVDTYAVASTSAVRDSASIKTRAAQALHWVNLVSGQFFRSHAGRFDRDQRADQMLLGNLRWLRSELHKAGLEDDDVCHDLLARIIFVQFLFDRRDSRGKAALHKGKLDSLHDEGVLHQRHADFPAILDDYGETYRLFDWLNTKFNGDLFPGKGETAKEREAGWRREKSLVKPTHLRLLSEFVKGDTDMPAGQRCLWPQYAFDVIPLEFISSIYETFVTRASDQGIYYTPPHLVDFILDRVLPWNGSNWNLRILDPSCGSGIFLVKAFQRLIYRWKRSNPDQQLRARILRGLLEKNLFGVDKDPHAVRVASFSLYLAMCDEIDPKHYWSEVVFPPMRDRRLVSADFFQEDKEGFQTERDAETYDLVIGNAPWGKKMLSKEANSWANDKKHQWPLANKEIGTLFLPKAAALTKPDGRIALIQSASSLLFTRSGPACDFRKKFFSTFHVEEIVNFSALRFEIFNRKAHASKTSVAPSCVAIFSPHPNIPGNKISYVSPKPVENIADEFDIVVEPQDIKSLYSDEAATGSQAWTALMWGNNRDKAFLKRLQQYRSVQVPGKEFDVSTREGICFGLNNRKPQPKIKNRLIFNDESFPQTSPVYLDASKLHRNLETHTHWKDSTNFDAFVVPQLLLKKGWKEGISRFQSRIVTNSSGEGVISTKSYITVHVPVSQSSFLEAAALTYNSKLATYFLLLTSGRFASYRPEPLGKELLCVPIPDPQENLLAGIQTLDDVDQRVREVFGFKDAEWALVEDLFNFTLPDFKGDAGSPGRQRTSRGRGEREEHGMRDYCEYFIRVLKAGFGRDKKVSATVFEELGDPLPYRLVAFELGREGGTPVKYESFDTPELLAELDRLNKSWTQHRSPSEGNLYRQRVARIYDYRDGVPTIFMLKPDARRYWTRSMGLYDGDEVAADFVRWGEIESQGRRH